MRKTPTALKWLAEKRARIAAELAQVELIIAEARERQKLLAADVAALDRTIQVYDPGLNPSDIAPVTAICRHGPRGSVLPRVLGVLQKYSPDWVSADVVALEMLRLCPVELATQRDRTRWYANNVGRALRKLATQGKVDREHDPAARKKEPGRWRVAQGTGTRSLAALRALAEGADRNDEDTERPEVAGREARPGGA